MSAGKLRHRVTIQTVAAAAADGQGGNPVTPTTLATVWADVQPAAGRELLQTRAISSQVPYLVEIHFRTDVTAGMRVVLPATFGGDTLEIHAVRPKNGQRARLLLDCGGLT